MLRQDGYGGAQLLTPLHGSMSNNHNSQQHNLLFGEAGLEQNDETEREQLEGFMMMYELVRPICRASLNEETLQERKKSRMNLKTQTMTATLKEAELSSKEAMSLLMK